MTTLSYSHFGLIIKASVWSLWRFYRAVVTVPIYRWDHHGWERRSSLPKVHQGARSQASYFQIQYSSCSRKSRDNPQNWNSGGSAPPLPIFQGANLHIDQQWSMYSCMKGGIMGHGLLQRAVDFVLNICPKSFSHPPPHLFSTKVFLIPCLNSLSLTPLSP